MNWYKIIIEFVLLSSYIVSLFGAIIVALCISAELSPEGIVLDLTLIIVFVIINAASGHCIRWFQNNTDNLNE